MSDVTCYELDLTDGPRGGVIGKMVEHPNGRYVLYSDYIALEARLETSQIELGAEREYRLELERRLKDSLLRLGTCLDLLREAQNDGISTTVSWDEWMDKAEQATGYDPHTAALEESVGVVERQEPKERCAFTARPHMDGPLGICKLPAGHDGQHYLVP